MEESYKILEYLPSSYKIPSESSYINFLWEAFESNYQNEKYQFSFLAYHMLYMSFVNFKVWQIKTLLSEKFKTALIAFNKDDEKKLSDSTSPFTFSEVNESNIFRFLKLINCDNSKIGQYVKLVRDRNDIAHSNGNIFYNSRESLDNSNVSNVVVYPNPYIPNDNDLLNGTPASGISFGNLPADAQIEIYTISGEKVFSQTINTSPYKWKVKNNSGSDVASGVYLYLIKSVTGKKTGKIAVIK